MHAGLITCLKACAVMGLTLMGVAMTIHNWTRFDQPDPFGLASVSRSWSARSCVCHVVLATRLSEMGQTKKWLPRCSQGSQRHTGQYSRQCRVGMCSAELLAVLLSEVRSYFRKVPKHTSVSAQSPKPKHPYREIEQAEPKVDSGIVATSKSLCNRKEINQRDIALRPMPTSGRLFRNGTCSHRRMIRLSARFAAALGPISPISRPVARAMCITPAFRSRHSHFS